jgi:DMSO reductase anchor subunit
MNPAFSVIAFTTLSGTGYGMLAWLGLRYAWRALPLSREFAATLFAVALALVSIGLLSSLLHLGQPGRAWRAVSQWRSSWLSREGVLALATYAPAIGLVCLIWLGAFDDASRLLGLLQAAMAIATVCATAMIYASLRTIPAWSDRHVLPGYVLYALLSGGAVLLTLLSLTGWRARLPELLGAMAGLVLLALLKLSYWRAIDRKELPGDRASALGMPQGRELHGFERPHTGENFVTREMGFVLARKHARPLRAIAIALSVMLPLLALLGIALHGPETPLWTAAAASLLLGAMVERWLFFAQARHVVMRYY